MSKKAGVLVEWKSNVAKNRYLGVNGGHGCARGMDLSYKGARLCQVNGGLYIFRTRYIKMIALGPYALVVVGGLHCQQ